MSVPAEEETASTCIQCAIMWDPFPVMENARFSPQIGYAGPMGLWQHNRGPAVVELGRAVAREHFAADSVK